MKIFWIPTKFGKLKKASVVLQCLQECEEYQYTVSYNRKLLK